MHADCECGSTVRNAFHTFGCLECGATCCPACAIHLESATYCRTCAGALLEATAVRAGTPFDLH